MSGAGNGNGPSGDALEARYDAWVAKATQAGEVWILVDEDDFNTVLEDDAGKRDLHMFFLTEADAAAEAQGTSPSALDLDELAGLLDQVQERGEGLALFDGASWIVAEPDLLGETLRGEL